MSVQGAPLKTGQAGGQVRHLTWAKSGWRPHSPRHQVTAQYYNRNQANHHSFSSICLVTSGLKKYTFTFIKEKYLNKKWKLI